MITMTTNDNTNTNAGDHEQQMVWLEIHHVLSPWHNHHINMSPLDMSSPLPSPSPQTLAFTSERFPDWFLPHHNKHHQQWPSTVRLPHLTIYPLHPILHPHLILMVSFLPFFLHFFFTNHLEHQVHSHHPHPIITIDTASHTQLNRLKTCLCLEPKIFFFHIYCTNVYLLYRLHMCTVTTKHVTMGTTSWHLPPQHINIPSDEKGLTCRLRRILSPCRFFFSLLFFTILTFIYD